MNKIRILSFAIPVILAISLTACDENGDTPGGKDGSPSTPAASHEVTPGASPAEGAEAGTYPANQQGNNVSYSLSAAQDGKHRVVFRLNEPGISDPYKVTESPCGWTIHFGNLYLKIEPNGNVGDTFPLSEASSYLLSNGSNTNTEIKLRFDNGDIVADCVIPDEYAVDLNAIGDFTVETRHGRAVIPNAVAMKSLDEVAVPPGFDIRKVLESAYSIKSKVSGDTVVITIHDDNLAESYIVDEYMSYELNVLASAEKASGLVVAVDSAIVSLYHDSYDKFVTDEMIQKERMEFSTFGLYDFKSGAIEINYAQKEIIITFTGMKRDIVLWKDFALEVKITYGDVRNAAARKTVTVKE